MTEKNIDEIKDELPEINDSTKDIEDGNEELSDEELSDEEKREILIEKLRKSKIKFSPIKHIGNVTINQFDSGYKKKRQRKNKMAKVSRKANRR
jgi:hypothetical protein